MIMWLSSQRKQYQRNFKITWKNIFLYKAINYLHFDRKKLLNGNDMMMNKSILYAKLYSLKLKKYTCMDDSSILKIVEIKEI